MHGGKLCTSSSLTDVRICFKEDCNPQGDPADSQERTSEDKKDENKYFIPMLVLAVALVLVIVISVAMICVTRKKQEHNRNNNSVEKSSERMENHVETGMTSVNLAKG